MLGGREFRVQTVVFALFCLLTLTLSSYVFAIAAKFENSASGHFKMACVLLFRCGGWSAAILIIQVLTVFLIWFFVYLPVLFIMGISGYMQAVIFEHVFQRLIDRGVITEEAES